LVEKSWIFRNIFFFTFYIKKVKKRSRVDATKMALWWNQRKQFRKRENITQREKKGRWMNIAYREDKQKKIVQTYDKDKFNLDH